MHELVGGPGASSPGKSLKFGALRMHLLHSGARIRAFEQNSDIIKVKLFFLLRESTLMNTLNLLSFKQALNSPRFFLTRCLYF